jgi:excisionase family DNA binding protein
MNIESNDKDELNMERYVDIKRVSRYTSLPVKTIYDWSNQGKFPCIKYGRRILFDLQDIDKVMARLKRPYHQHEKVVNKIIGDLHGNGI